MRSNLILGAAVVAALAGGNAVAASSSIDIYASGSSAMSSFFSNDLKFSLCGGASVATATYLDSQATTYEPSFSAYQCTNATTSTTYTLHYSAELGSTWGVFEAANPTSTRQFLTPSAAGCPAGSYTVKGKAATQAGAVWPTPGSTSYCTATGYNHVTDSVTTNTNNILSPSAADIVVSDVEPDLFLSDNWPTANHDPSLRPAILGPTAPNAATILAATNLMNPVQGQIFQVIAHGIPGSTDGTAQPATPFNISSASLRAILVGSYRKWVEVPEVGAADTATGGTPINICRRDHGSGTEIGADITFTGYTCNQSTGGTVANTQPVLAGTVTSYTGATSPWVYEAPASADMKACVSSTPGTIGFLSNTTKDTGFNYQILYVDGYAPTAHNAAAGLYRYAYDVNMAATGNATAGAGAAATLVADAQNWAALNTDGFAKEAGTYAEGGNGVVGGFVPTTIGNVTLYTIPGTDGGAVNSGSGATELVTSASGVTVEALFNRGQDNCNTLTNTNTN